MAHIVIFPKYVDPNYRPQNTMVLIMGTPIIRTIVFWERIVLCYVRVSTVGWFPELGSIELISLNFYEL